VNQTDAVNSISSSVPFSFAAGTMQVASTFEVANNAFSLQGGDVVGGTITIDSGASFNPTSGTLDGVTVDGDFVLTGNHSLTAKDGLTLNGTAMLGDSSGGGWIDFSGSQTLEGSGAVVYGVNNSYNGLFASGTNPVLTIGSGITISEKTVSYGYLGYDSYSGVGSTSASVINQGTIEWSNGGNISIPETLTNSGTITVDATSTMAPGGTIAGGTITTQAGAQISGGTLDGVTVDGDWQVLNGNSVTITDGLTLDGTLSLGNGSSYGYLNFNGSQTLGGTGSVVFGAYHSGPYYSGLFEAASGGTLTIGSGVTVRGQLGIVGTNYPYQGSTTVAVVNQGTIQADVSGGTIDVLATGAQNSGSLKALNGATLNLQGSGWQDTGVNYADATSSFTIGASFSNTANTIALTGPGSFILNGAIQGGIVNVAAGTPFSLTGGTLDGVTVDGDWQVLNGNSVTITDGLTLDGTLSLGNGSSYGYLNFNGSQTLGGTGSVVFGAYHSGPYYSGLFEATSGGTLTIGSGVTVRGQLGIVGTDYPYQGASTAAVVNQGTIQWAAGGNILIPGTLTNAGTITVDATSTMAPGGTIAGGTITTQAGAQISGGTLDGVTVDGDWQVLNGNSVTITDGLTLDGTLSLGNGSSYGYLNFNGSQTLGGTGSVVFGAYHSGPYYSGLFEATSGGTLTIGSGVTVRGQLGIVGTDYPYQGASTAAVVNQGTIQADVSGGTIDVLATGAQNSGSLKALNGATLYIGGSLTNTATVSVDGTSTLSLGGTLTGGTITTQAGAQISGSTLDGVTIDGAWQVLNGNSVTITDGLTLDGTLSLGNGSSYGYLNFNGSQTLGGTGSVVFGAYHSGPYYSGLFEAASGGTLTIGSGVTVRGQLGIVGTNYPYQGSTTVAVVNQGTIQADVSGGTISISDTGATFANAGLLDASLGTIAISAGSSGVLNDGTVSVGPTGVLSIAGNFAQSAGADLDAVLGGSSTNLFGHVGVSGTATLDGTLNVSEANGFSPGTGNLFKFLTFTSSTGQFADYTGLTLAGNVALQPGYDPTDVTLTTVTSSTIAPDLRVTDLALSPGNPQSSQIVTINWNDANSGNGSTGGSWTDRVVVVNTTTGQTIATADVPYDAATSGDLASNGVAAQSYSFRLPDGPASVGNLQVSVTVDYFNTIAEFYPGNVGESNNTSTISVSSTLNSYPDLQVTGLAVTQSNLESGQNVTIDWNDANAGLAATAGSWSDQVTVVNTSTGQTLLTTNVPYDATVNGNISAGGTSPQQSYAFRLPDGPAGVGQLQLTVTADIDNNIFEFNAEGTAETNNAASITTTSTLAPYPDLQVSGLSVNPSEPQSGQNVTINWTDANTGNASTAGSWYDQVSVVNTTTGQTLATSNVLYDNTALGNIAAGGASAQQSYTFRLPDGAPGVGQLRITVTADVANDVFEYNPGGTGETNNTATISATSTVAAYPDLQINGLVVDPTAPQSGLNITVNWTDANTGNASTTGSWYDQVNVVNTTTGQTLATSNVLYDSTALGNIAAGTASAQQSYTFRLPDGAPGVGQLQITVTADINNNLFEYNASGTGESNNTATISATSILGPYPDLQVTGLTVDPSSVLQSGNNVTLDWNDADTGNATATASFYDHIVVVNASTGATLVDTTLYHDESIEGAIPAGGSLARQDAFRLPDGGPGAGSLQVTVTADTFNQVFESNSSGTAESNNTASISANSSVASYPDLQVTNLAVSPAGLQSGASATISWSDVNTGNAAVSSAFSDHLVVTNLTTGEVLLNTSIGYDPTANGNAPIASGASLARQYPLQLPDGVRGTGQIQFTITTDWLNQVFEYNAGGTGETNNTTSLTATSSLAPYADLAASNVTGPSTVVPGQQITVGWTVSNTGSVAAAGPWTEQVLLATDASGDNPTLLAALTYPGPLAAGQSIPRSATVQIPSLPAGSYWVVVSENPDNEVFETDTTNNTAIAAQPTGIAGALTVSLASHSVSNGAGANATTAIVSRNSSLSSALVVTLTSSNPQTVTVPQTVTIPAGQTSASFPVGTINNGVAVGTQTATLTASATGELSGSDLLTITDSNVPTLSLTLSSHSLDELAANPAATGTVTRNTPTDSALVVTLLSNSTNKITVPVNVTIPAGQASATFPLTVIDDHQIDGNANATITASVPGFVTGADTAQVIDENVPMLQFVLAQQTISETAGAHATTGTVSLSAPISSPVVVNLTSSDDTAATVPSQIIILPGQSSVTFSIVTVDDGLDLGDKMTTITAQVVATTGQVLSTGQASQLLTVTEHDGPALTITLPVAAIAQDGSTLATVSRNTATSDPLVVTLSSSDTTHATVPDSVTIPAGQSSATFLVTGVNDGLMDGEQYSQISATAVGLETGLATIGVTSVNLPDLTVTNVSAPISGLAGSQIQVTWTVSNSGLFSADGSWTDDVYLDPVNGAKGGGLLDQVAFDSEVAAGQAYTQTATITLPTGVGQYNVRVVADADQQLQELAFNNNSASGTQSINVQAPYTATVSTTIASSVPTGTPVPLSGLATLIASGQPAANVPVAVQILVDGTERTLTATTDAQGDYSTTFQPLANEAGDYAITAGYPGAPLGTTQAQFQIVGISATPPNATLQVVPDTPLTGQFTLTNMTDAPLSGITATAESGPAGLSVQLNTPQTLWPSGQATLSYSFTATGAAGTGVVVIHITSSEGAVCDIPVAVQILSLSPQLSANPGFLNTGMVVGQQTLVSFQVTNGGGAPSGPISVLLPNASFLSLASAATMPSLASGASTTITVALTPAATLALQQYTGTIAVNYAGTGLSVPFTFRAITTAVGDVQVSVDDDFTFTETGAPRVAGATVNLLDPYDNSIVDATGTTDSSGQLLLSNVPAGQYVIRVSASGHDSYETSYSVVPGISNNVEAFLNNDLVTYSWQVTPTNVADQYDIQLQTTFQTDVPAPVLTISAPSALPALEPGQSGQILLTLTNHGLIEADNVSVVLPNDPEYSFTALATSVGIVPAGASVTVPVIVHRADSMNPASMIASTVAAPAADSGGSLDCTLDIAALYYFDCDGQLRQLRAATTTHVDNRVCDSIAIVTNFIKNFFATQVTVETQDLPSTGSIKGVPGPGPDVGQSHTTDGHDHTTTPGIDEPAPPSFLELINCNPTLAKALDLATKVLSKVPYKPLQLPAKVYQGVKDAAGAVAPILFPPAPQPPDLRPLAGLLFPSSGEASAELVTSATPDDSSNNLVATLQVLENDQSLLDQLAGAIESVNSTSSLTSLGTGLQNAISNVTASEAGLQSVITVYTDFLGSMDWLKTTQTVTSAQWISTFMIDTTHSPDGSITPADEVQLLSLSRPDTVGYDDATEFINRWNQTIAYYQAGISTVAQVPAGESTDFVDVNVLAQDLATANNAILTSEAEGYSDPAAELVATLNQFVIALNDNSVCATLQLQINQTVMLTRSAFTGTLSLSDQMSTDSLQDVELDLNVTDANGNPVNGEFFISSPTLGGGLTAVNGTGVLPAGSTGSVSYTFIPADSAAADGPTVYYIGGTLTYVDPDMGGEVVTPIFPAAITVYPQPKLEINYFLQKDVIGDDPSTPEVEPSEPAVLGMLVTNAGGGTATNLSITTAQPQIVQNDKGLLDTFQIVGTQVGTQQETPSLTASLGDIAPGGTADADFLLLSSLQGQFQDFSATFSHTDALGGTSTSLIASVTTHQLIHAGDFQYPGSTGEIDYLVNDVPDPNSTPDTVYLSNGTTAPVNTATNISVNGTISDSQLSVQVTAQVTSGWVYLQLPDPGAGYTLTKVVRSDGTVLPVSDAAWTTDRTIAPTGKATVDYELHILDLDSTGSYTVYYRPTSVTAPALVSIQPIANPQSGPISSVEVTFNEPIDPATFTWQNVTLTLNGGANLITPAVTVTQTSPTTFTIGNLSGLTAANGNYELTVSASGVNDLFGDVGAGSLSESWSLGVDVPVVVSVGAGNPSIRNSPVQTVDVVLTEPIVNSSFDYHSLTLSLDGGPNLITPAVTVVQVSSTTYRIAGLASLTQAEGTYVLTVSADSLTDAAGHAGVGASSEQWVMDTTPPTIASLGPSAQSPRNIVVPFVDVTFSEPVDPTTFNYHNIVFSKAGGPNLIIPSITITWLSTSEVEISNFENLIAPIDGNYTFMVNAAGARDLAGNLGSGSASESWTLLTSLPVAPTNLAIMTDAGVLSPTGLVNNGSVTLTGTLNEHDLTVHVFDGSTFVGDAAVSGETFSAPLLLTPGAHALSVYVVDAANNASPSTGFSAFFDNLAPTVSIDPISPSLRNTAVSQMTIRFSQPVSGLSLADLQLTVNGGANLLAGSQMLTTNDGGSTWSLGNLAGVTGASGSYSLTLLPTGVEDLTGNPLAAGTSASWLADFLPPTSKVSPLPQRQNSLSFSVSATGSDNAEGSGVGSYDLYVSTNGGPFVLWTTVPASNPTATFTAQSNTTYAFHSIAHDNAGNAETKSAGAIEASTYVPDLTPPVTQITSAVPSAAGAFALAFSGTSPGGSGVKSFLLSVQVDNGPIVQIGQFTPGAPTAGVYSGQATYQGLTDGNLHTYVFYIQGTNGNGVQEAPHAGASVTTTFQAPVIPQATGFSIEKGLSERSYIRYVDVTFNEPVSQLSLGTAHVILEQFGLDGTTFVQNIDLTGKIKLIDHVMEIDFGTGGIGGKENLANTLANWQALVGDDGYYKLLIDPDGTGAHDIEEDFYRLFGDVVGNMTGGPTVTGPVAGSSNVIGAVTTADLNAIASAIGQTATPQNPLLNADVNGAGSVTANDRVLAAKSQSAGRRLAIGLRLSD
jgi:hypothetical protein